MKTNRILIHVIHLSLVMLSLFVFAITFSSCNNNHENNNEYEEKKLLENQEEEVFLNNSTEYILSELPGTIRVDNYYNVYSLDNEFTEEMCSDQGVEYDNMVTYLEMSKEYTDISMLIIPSYQLMDKKSFEITVKIKDEKDYGIENLYDESESFCKQYADVLTYGFDVDGYEFLTEYGNNTRFIVFDCVLAGRPQRRYASIINGKMIYIIAEDASGVLTEEQIADIENMISHLAVRS